MYATCDISFAEQDSMEEYIPYIHKHKWQLCFMLKVKKTQYIFMVIGQKPPDKSHPDKSSPTIIPGIKPPPKKKTWGMIFF